MFHWSISSSAHDLKFKRNGILPFLFPTAAVSGWASNEVDGRLGVAVGCCNRDFDMAVEGRFACAEGGRPPKPPLLEKELLETLRTDDTEAGRAEETEEEKDDTRGAPAIEVALTAALTGLELGGAGAGLDVSPPRSVRVFLFRWFGGGGIIDENRAF